MVGDPRNPPGGVAPPPVNIDDSSRAAPLPPQGHGFRICRAGEEGGGGEKGARPPPYCSSGKRMARIDGRSSLYTRPRRLSMVLSHTMRPLRAVRLTPP